MAFDWDWGLCVWDAHPRVADAPGSLPGVALGLGQSPAPQGVAAVVSPCRQEPSVCVSAAWANRARAAELVTRASDTVVVLGTVAGNSFSW